MPGPRPGIAFVCPDIRPIARPVLSAFAIVVAAAGTHAVARAQAPRNVGGWIVAASRDASGCFLTRTYDRRGGTTLLLGLEVDGTNRLSVLNANWSIRPKDRLELTFRLSGASFPRHFAVGIASGDEKGFVTSFGETFPAQFAASRSLQIFRGDVPVERLDLDGSGAAVTALRGCVDAQRGRPAVGEEQSDSIPKDPFAPAPKRKGRR